jgi:phosphomannomutase/phosphoglucomutase
VPTPAWYFALQHLRAGSGVMVTASHNPARYNGFKLQLGEWPVSEEQIAEVRRLVERGEFATGKGSLQRQDILPAYTADRRGILPRADGLTVVADFGGGAACLTAPELMAGQGANLVPLHDQVDPTLSVRNPNPAVPEHLTDLRQAVREHGADLGVAFDGDGDRVAFVDQRGEPLEADVASVLFVRHLLGARNSDYVTVEQVVHDIKCSAIVPDAVRAGGAEPIMERSGYSFMRRRMMETRALLGCEASGHFFFRALDGGDDGVYAALLLCDVLRRAGKPLSKLVAAVPRYVTTPDLRIPYDLARAPELLERVRSGASGEVSELDGVRAQYAEGWALLRASITEPVVTLRFEAKSREALQEIVADFLAAAPELREAVAERLRML